MRRSDASSKWCSTACSATRVAARRVTDADRFAASCRELAFTPVAFHGFQSLAERRVPIHQTHVTKALGERYCVIRLDAVYCPAECAAVVAAVAASAR